MVGAIAGDIIGSVYEEHNIKTKSFPLFQPGCRFTDDSVLTCAVAEAAYGVPYIIRREALSRLPLILKSIVEEFESRYRCWL